MHADPTEAIRASRDPAMRQAMKHIITLSLACVAMAASAEDVPLPFSIASFESGEVQLFMAQGQCQGQAHMARGINKDGSEPNIGCWLPAGPYIQVVWLRGTIDRIPLQAFKKPTDF